MTKKKQKLTGGHAVIIIVLILLALICFYPMWYTLIMSFSDKGYVDAGRTWLIPLGLNVKSYGKILKDSLFFSAMWVSVKRVIVGCAVSMFMLIITAYPLCVPEKKFPASKYIKWFFLANMMFSGGLIPFYTLMRQYHLFNSFWVLILPGALPLWNMILMMNFFRGIPGDLEEAARVDGAGPWRILWQIVVPCSKPVIATIVLFTSVGYWNEYFQGLVLMNKETNYPLQTYIRQISVQIPVGVTLTAEQYQQLAQNSNKSLEAAKVFIALVPMLIVYPFLQKYFVTGITLGAVKE